MLGKIHSIESLATHEGYGLRAAVFMHGCPIRCCYCHNPDAWFGEAKQTLSADELLQKLLRLKPYFKNDGGVTFTGGEPIIQSVFLNDVIKKLTKNGINSAIDTSCVILNDEVKELYSLCEFVITDLKFYTKEQYIKHTGADIFDTVIKTLNYLNQINKPVIVRTVVIPGINDTEQDILYYANLVKCYNNIKEYELKPFHTMGFQKYKSLGLKNPLGDIQAMNAATVEKLNKIINDKLKN